MKKSRIIILVCLIVFVLFAVGNFLFFYSIRQVNWWGKPSVSPCTARTEWYSEEGNLSFSTFEKFSPAEYFTQGILMVEEEDIPIYINLGHDGSFYILLNDKPFFPNETYKTLEKWEGIDYKETETEVVITLRVKETTYFTEGQKVKLIHKKAS